MMKIFDFRTRTQTGQKMKKAVIAAACLFSLIAASAGHAQTGTDPAADSIAQPSPPPAYDIALLDGAGKSAGTVKITEGTKGVLFTVTATGLTPGWHGVHIHGSGDCSDHAAHFQKAGGHAMSEGQKHGFFAPMGPHDGDLPNIWIAANGEGSAEFFSTMFSGALLKDKDGSALMIHAGPDDHMTDPSGNSGDRVSCGVISAAQGDSMQKLP
jgi:superoxide dismutase, Cu-Zn family